MLKQLIQARLHLQILEIWEPLILEVKASPDSGIKLKLEMMQYCNVDLHSWLSGFDNVEQSVRGSVHLVKHHPLVPKDVTVRGFIIDSQTGELTEFKNID